MDHDASDAPRWWLASPGGQPQGPFTAEALRRMSTMGQVADDGQVCREGATDWVPWRSVAEIAGPASGPGGSPPPPPRRAVPPGPVSFGDTGPHLEKVSYVLPILSTVFCCLIGGIVAIIYTAKANEAAVAGDPITYASARSSARTWMIVSVVLMLVIWVLQIGFVIVSGAGMMNTP